MKSALLALVLFSIAPSCTNESAARQTLEDAGFTNIELTGYSAFTCSKSDDTCTGFTAIGPTGHRVKGAVGCGYACKGCTIRFN
jgi:hypothetical protein